MKFLSFHYIKKEYKAVEYEVKCNSTDYYADMIHPKFKDHTLVVMEQN